MLPIRRTVLIGRSSQSHNVLKLTYCKLKYNYLEDGRRSNSSGDDNTRKSSLYSKAESKIYQQNIPVELDLDFHERLKVKDQLGSELSSRNITDIDINQLERDYLHMNELIKRKTELENEQKIEITEKMQDLKKKQEKMSDKDEKEQINKMMADLRERGKMTKKQIKNIIPDLRDTEERVMLTALKLPNTLHKDTPLSEDRIEDSVGKGECRLSHVDIGTKFNLIKFSNIGSKAYYFKDKLALLEQTLINYFSDSLRQEGYTQMSCPEFFKSLVVEGCGIDPENSEQNLELRPRPDDISTSFVTGVSIMSFVAYITKSKIKESSLPLKYFTYGRSYTSETKSYLPGLFDAAQSVKITVQPVMKDHPFCQQKVVCHNRWSVRLQMSMFCVCVDLDEGNNVVEKMKDHLYSIYKHLNIPCRIVTVSPLKLLKSEEKKVEVQMWAKSIQKYIKIASISVLSDYISRRLMIRQGKQSLPVNVVHCEVLDTTRLIAVLMEYGTVQQDLYSLPDLDFLDTYWIESKTRNKLKI